MSGGGALVLLYVNSFLLAGVLLRHFFKRLSRIIPYTARAAATTAPRQTASASHISTRAISGHLARDQLP